MRGQAYTLEAIIASFILVAGLVFALQVTAVTPLSASTSNQYIENQQTGTVRGVLVSAGQEAGPRSESPLKRTLLFWGDEDTDGKREFHCAAGDKPYYTGGPDLSTCNIVPGDRYSDARPPNRFGAMLDNAFGPGVAYNMIITYRTGSDSTETKRLIFQGKPSDNAIRVTTVVTLYDSDEVYDSSGKRTGNDLPSGAADFYMPDAYTSKELYNVVEVEVTVWRI